MLKFLGVSVGVSVVEGWESWSFVTLGFSTPLEERGKDAADDVSGVVKSA